jgi:hypothetical protein
MATTLYLRNTTTNGIASITTPHVDTVYDMVTTAGAGSATCVVTLTSGGTDIPWTVTADGNHVGWISGRAPVGGFTLTSVSISNWQNESNANDNSGGACRVYRYRAGVCLELGAAPFEDDVEMNNSAREDTWTADVDNTVFLEDDRVLIVFTAVDKGSMTSGTATITFNAAAGATGDSFITLFETITFKAEDVTFRGKVLVGGAWKSILTAKVLVGGAWKNVAAIKDMVGGAWKTV